MSGKRRRADVPAIATRRSTVKKVVTDFPAPLFQETERVARELSMNRSAFIRSAVEAFLRNRQRETLEKAIAESLLANSELDRQLREDFKYADADELL